MNKEVTSMVSYRDVDQLKAKLDSFRPLPAEIVQNLHDVLVLQWTYHSNAIEGNTLTLKETKVALEGITVGGKTLREHFEVINHREAILYVEDIVQTQQALSERVIKGLHQCVLKNIDEQNAGRYRSSNVIIAGAEHKPINALHVTAAMETFIAWYEQEAINLPPIERAARIHADFVKIHPFGDGNGRTSRLLMNLELLKAGFPAVVIELGQRLDYYEALDTAHCTGNYDDFIELVKSCVVRSFEAYWWALGLDSKSLSN